MNIGPLRDFIFKKAEETVMKKTLGLYPAPLKILDVTFSYLAILFLIIQIIAFNLLSDDCKWIFLTVRN